jgi:hypothetical protein
MRRVRECLQIFDAAEEVWRLHDDRCSLIVNRFR